MRTIIFNGALLSMTDGQWSKFVAARARGNAAATPSDFGATPLAGSARDVSTFTQDEAREELFRIVDVAMADGKAELVIRKTRAKRKPKADGATAPVAEAAAPVASVEEAPAPKSAKGKR